MIQFANPIYLWTLAGLSIPIAIHLLSRKEGKVIRLGSLRHVHETSTQQFKGFRLNEVLLLALRCSLVTILSLLLSGMQWNIPVNTRWLLIENGLEAPPPLMALADSLSKEGYETRWMMDNFPLIQDSTIAAGPLDYWNLIEQLKDKNISEVVVFAKNSINGFKGLRPPLPPNVRWISQPVEPRDYVLQASQVKGDSIVARLGHTGARETYFTTKKLSQLSDSVSINPLEKITVVIVSDEQHAYDARILRASLNAIAKSIPIKIELREITPTDSPTLAPADWYFWLSNKTAFTVPSNIILLRPQPADDIFIRTNGKEWTLSKRLNEEVALQTNMTLALASIIGPGRQPLEEKAEANDRRMLPDPIAWAEAKAADPDVAGVHPHVVGVQAGLPEETAPTQQADAYLLGLFLILLFIERLIAYKRNQ